MGLASWSNPLLARLGRAHPGVCVDRGVFINYRGEDSSSNGAWLYTELTHRLGEEHPFLDAECIPAGADFVQENCWVGCGRLGSCWR